MDTLMRTKKLEELGFERPKAEGLVLMVKESIDEEVAKKADLERVETSLRTDLERVETSLRTELKLEIANVRSDIKVLSRDLMLKLGALMITMTGIIIGVLSGVISVYLK